MKPFEGHAYHGALRKKEREKAHANKPPVKPAAPPALDLKTIKGLPVEVLGTNT